MPPRPPAGTAFRSRSGLWLGLGAALLASLSLLSGWWLGQRSLESVGTDRSRLELEQQADLLRREVSRGDASAGQQQRLLQLLLALGKKEEAATLLERMADQQPQRWTLRLMLAELRRDQKDLSGAEREVRQLLNLRPDRVEALQLMALLQLEQGRGSEAETRLTAAYQGASRSRRKEQSLAIGLVLADLQQRRGQTQQAEALYRKLAAANPADPRPVLAQALLKQQQGQTRAALDLLDQARRQRPNQQDPRLDEVATAWGLAPLRKGSGLTPPKAPSLPTSPGSAERENPAYREP